MTGAAATAGRLTALRALLADDGLGAIVVTDAANVRYLTGYVGSNGTAVVSGEAAVLLTDSRYAVSARAQVTDAEVVIGSRDLLGDIARIARDLAGEGPVAVEAESVTLAWHERFTGRLETTPRATRGLVEGLRLVKDAGEVALMRRAAAVADEALAHVLSQGIVGRTEREVAFALHGAMLDRGADDLSFPTIVAAGPRGARPHAVPGTERIGAGQHRAPGPLPADLERIYTVCLEAQEAALAAARPGISGADLDAVARDHIAAAGFGDHFGHGLGHGVGLEIHEGPGVRPTATDALRAGMAITIEPGIYIEGAGGVRIEDLVILTDDGCDIISGAPKTLTIVQ